MDQGTLNSETGRESLKRRSGGCFKELFKQYYSEKIIFSYVHISSSLMQIQCCFRELERPIDDNLFYSVVIVAGTSDDIN